MNSAQEMEDEISLIDIVRVLIKRKTLIVGGTLICFTGALLFAFLKPSPPKMYQTSLAIQVGETADGSIEPLKSRLIEPLNVVKSKLENDYLLGQGVDIAGVKISVSERGKSILVLRGESSSPNLGKAALEGLKVKLLNDHDRMIKKHRAAYITKKENDITQKERNIDQKGKKPKFILKKIEALKASNELFNKELLYISSSESVREENPGLILQVQNKLTANTLQIADLEWTLIQNKETLKKDKETLSQFKEEGDLIQGTKILQEPTTIEMPAPASKKKLIVILGVVAGMMLSVFLVFFLEFVEKYRREQTEEE